MIKISKNDNILYEFLMLTFEFYKDKYLTSHISMHFTNMYLTKNYLTFYICMYFMYLYLTKIY